MADILGVSRSTYANWETNTEPDLSILRTMATIFQMPLEQLIGEDKNGFEVNEPSVSYGKVVPELTQSMLSKLVDGNKILANAQQDAITTAKDAVATANKVADGNLVLIEANNKMASLIIEMQRKTVTEPILQDNLAGVDAKLKVLLELSILDGVGRHWNSYDEGEAKLNKRIDEAIQNTQALDSRTGAGK